MSEKKSVLIINQKSPYGDAAARESLDIALTCSIFEMPVTLLFCGDAIFQLLKDQQPGKIQQKKIEAMLSALPMYDITEIYVEHDSLIQNGLTDEDLCLPVTLIDQSSISQLINLHDTVLTF